MESSISTNPINLKLKRPQSAQLAVAIFLGIAVGVTLTRVTAAGYAFIGIGIIELLYFWHIFGRSYVEVTEDRVKIRQLFSGEFHLTDITKVVYISKGYTIHVKGGKEYRVELENMDEESREKAKSFFHPMVDEILIESK
ncbi:MAG: hypothetical protein P8X57_15220 [Cyclobacteriaceae bacterium]